MPRKIALILGHPESSETTYCAALADAYSKGAEAGGHTVRRINVGALDFSFLHNKQEFSAPPSSPDIAAAQKAIAWAEHIVIIYPLWLGSMPAILKAFLEQICTGGFAIAPRDGGKRWDQKLKGRSARIVVTMGMPALIYRWFFRAHSVKSLERNILKFAGIRPIRETLIGLVESSQNRREKWLDRVEKLGRRGR